MRALVERAPGIPFEKEASVTKLYNGLVMAAAEPSVLPQPGKIDRDFKRVGAMTKDSRVSALVTKSVVTALAATHGPAEADFFYQLDPTIDRLTALNRELSERMRQPVSTIGVIIDALDNTRLRGQSDPHALERAKQLLSQYSEAMTHYDPHLRDNPEIKAAMVANEKDVLIEKAFDVIDQQQKEVKVTSGGIVVDRAHVHKTHPGDTTTYTIRKITAPKPDLIYYQGFDRDKLTAKVEVLTADGHPLEYSMTLLVKTDAGEWRPVSLAEPVTGDAYNPKHHLEVQQSHMWTTDLPQTKGKYAVVVESTPWHVDRDRREEGSIYASLEQGEDADGSATAFLINAARSMGISLSSLFWKDGLPKGEVRLSPYSSGELLKKLQAYGYTEALKMPVSRSFKGRTTVERTMLSFSARIGVPGNEGTVPLSILVDGKVGDELFSSKQKEDEVDHRQKTIKATEDEKRDRRAICDSLEIDKERTEIFFFDTVTTHAKIHEGGISLGNRTATRVTTAEIGLAPLTRLESQGTVGSVRTTVEAAPFLDQQKVFLPIEREMEPGTLEEVLTYASESAFAGNTHSQIRIVSPQIVEALAEEERIKEEMQRRFAPPHGWDTGGLSIMRGSYAATGVSTLLWNFQARGTAEVMHSKIVGALPELTVAVTAELPELPERIKKRTRRRYLQ